MAKYPLKKTLCQINSRKTWQKKTSIKCGKFLSFRQKEEVSFSIWLLTGNQTESRAAYYCGFSLFLKKSLRKWCIQYGRNSSFDTQINWLTSWKKIKILVNQTRCCLCCFAWFFTLSHIKDVCFKIVCWYGSKMNKNGHKSRLKCQKLANIPKIIWK